MANNSAKRSRGGGAPGSPTSRITDAEPSFLEMRNSLLYTLEESLGEKRCMTNRLLCISKMKNGVTNAQVGKHYEQLVANFPHPDDVTGLMLIYPMHCVHILEAAADTMIQYLKDVRKQTTDPNGLFMFSKNLNVAHNITTLLFQNWMFTHLDIQTTGIGEYETTEPTENLVIDMVINATKLGLFLSKQPKLSYNSAVQALHEKIPECLPQQDVLEYLLEKRDPAVEEVENFLQNYELPYPVTLEGERVWPMPDHLMPSLS